MDLKKSHDKSQEGQKHEGQTKGVGAGSFILFAV
jgi:hypothetical protein